MTAPPRGAFKLDGIVPWGRNRDEYLAFFDLAGTAPGASFLDCAGGPSSFNAEMTRAGRAVVSADPLYAAPGARIAARIEETRVAMMRGVTAARDRFVWRNFDSLEAFEAIRLGAMKLFLDDLDDGLAEGRYIDASLPDLPFDDDAFDIVLCSHFLFLYSADRDLEFHLASIREMLRVGREARIFPLLNMEGEDSEHIAPLCEALDTSGVGVEIRAVAYEFQKGGNRMLRITRPNV